MRVAREWCAIGVVINEALSALGVEGREIRAEEVVAAAVEARKVSLVYGLVWLGLVWFGLA